MANHQSMNGLQESLRSAAYTLSNRKGSGNEFTGWLDLPERITPSLRDEILLSAERLRNHSEYVVVVGIGGSYLGTRAVLEAVGRPLHHLDQDDSFPHILFAGHHLSATYHKELLRYLENKDYALIVISKSGTTTEPAIAFRLLKQQLIEKYGEENTSTRIIAITDGEKGALRTMADSQGYTSFIVPDDVGGRYSVLSTVGLVPLATAGISIDELLQGAADMKKLIDKDPVENPAARYALARIAMYYSGKPVEILVNYEPGLTQLGEWWKQLFGESEGKQGKGIFPAAVSNTTDLHSMGQYIQDGLRILFETVISVENTDDELTIPYTTDDLDGLNYLAGRPLHEVNTIAEEATRQAHIDGGVPNIKITLPELNPYYLGQLIYLFEYACGLSAYMLNLNPFDQPGVEEYKTNMFRLLGKR